MTFDVKYKVNTEFVSKKGLTELELNILLTTMENKKSIVILRTS